VIKGMPSTGITLKDLPPEKMMDGIYRVHRIDITILSGLLGQDLFDTILRLEPDSDHGYVRKWPVPGFGEAKHLGYAFQWFAMALALLVIYLVVNVKKSGQ